MSLKTFLAVGESFSGTDEKSYALKEQQIPIFATTAEAEVAEKGDQNLLTSIPTGQNEGQMTLGPQVEPVREPERRIHIAPERRRIETEPDERRRFLKRWSKPTIRRLTQAEMTLANVQVVRNDLSDSDLEVVMKAKGKKTDRLAGTLALPAETVAAEERRGVDTAAYREKADSKFGI